MTIPNSLLSISIYTSVLGHQQPQCWMKCWTGIPHTIKPHSWFFSQILMKPLQWRHNGHDSVSNHQPHDCLLNRLFRRRSKKTLKLHVIGLYVRNSAVLVEFPAQMASNVENVSIWWRHHESPQLCGCYPGNLSSCEFIVSYNSNHCMVCNMVL